MTTPTQKPNARVGAASPEEMKARLYAAAEGEKTFPEDGPRVFGAPTVAAKQTLDEDALAIVEAAEEYGASFILRGDKWFVAPKGDAEGPFGDIVAAAKAYCEANDYPLPGNGSALST